MQNETIHRQNKVLAPVILAVSIILAVLVLRPFYTDMIEKSSILDRTQIELEGKTTYLDGLKKTQALIESGSTSDLKKKVDQLGKKFDVPDIMQTVMLNDYTKPTLSTDARIAIG